MKGVGLGRGRNVWPNFAAWGCVGGVGVLVSGCVDDSEDK